MAVTRSNFFDKSVNVDLCRIMEQGVTKVHSSMISSGRFIPFKDVVSTYDHAISQSVASNGKTDDIFREECYRLFGSEKATSYFELIAVLSILRDASAKLLAFEINGNPTFRDNFHKVRHVINTAMIQDLIVSRFGYGECGERATKLIFDLVEEFNETLHRVVINKSSIDNHVFVLTGPLPKPFTHLKNLNQLNVTNIFGDPLFNLTGNGSDVHKITDLMNFGEECTMSVQSIDCGIARESLDKINPLVDHIVEKMIKYKGLFDIIQKRASQIKDNGEVVEQAQPKLSDILESCKAKKLSF